jgi:hypothetical protein
LPLIPPLIRYARKPLPGETPELLPIVTSNSLASISFGEKSERGRGGMEAKVEPDCVRLCLIASDCGGMEARVESDCI